MKKTLQHLGKIAAVSTFLLSFSAFAGPGVSYAPLNSSFINNGTYVCISNNMTWTFDTASNVFFMPFQTFTNVYALTTNGNNQLNTWPPAFVDVTVPPDGNGEASGNLAIQIVVGITNGFPFPYAQSPVVGNTINNFTNLNAAIGGGTNTVTLTFAPVYDMGPLVTGISQGSASIAQVDKQFTFACTETNNAVVVLTTNLPTSMTQGVTKLRLIKAVVNNVNTAGVVINALSLRGWTP